MYPLYTHKHYVTSHTSFDFALLTLTAAIQRYHMVSVDVETTGLETLEHSLVSVTIATPDVAFIFPEPYYSDPRLWDIVGRQEVIKLMHNAPFDWGYIYDKLRVNLWPLMDTKRLAIGAFNIVGRDSGLKRLVLRFLQHTMLSYDDVKPFIPDEPFTLKQIEYAAEDALALWPLMYSLLAQRMATGAYDALFYLMVTRLDLIPMTLYLDNIDKWPAHGHYLSLDTIDGQPLYVAGESR